MVFNIVQLLLVVIALLMNYDEGFVFQCPHHAQWNLRAKEICNVTEKYYCLFDDNNKQYTEFCRESYNFEKSGYKLIVVGDLQREICHSNRYQPIQFWSNGSSDCILYKSRCNEEGQLIFHNGTNVGDRACRCDYSKGYDFVNTPTNRCFVIPLDEDCSCYLKQCDAEQILTPDYRCVNTSEWKPPFICSIKTFIQSSVNTPPDQKRLLLTFTATHNLPGLHDYRLDCVVVLCAVIPVFIALGIFAIVLQEFLTREVAMKEVENIETKLNISTEDKKIEINSTGQTSTDIWKMHLAKFLPTTASEHIFKVVKMHHCILITGPPGCGKTAIAYHIAFKLEQSDGYRVGTLTMPGEVLKLESSINETKQVLIIDDVIGKSTICNCNVEMIRDAIKIALQKNSNIKIIMTCRSHIYLMNDFVGTFFHHCDMLLSNMQLSVNERRTMLERYLGDNLNIEDNVLMLYNFFPSLCVLAEGEKEHLSAFLTYPVSFLNQEISTSRTYFDVLYLALSVIVVKSNNVEKTLYDQNNADAEAMLQDIFRESGFLQFPVKSLLYLTLQSLNQTFIIETETSFSLLNDTLFDIMSIVVGGSLIRSILKYGSVTFINHRMQFDSLKETRDLFTILIPSELEDVYFTRKLRDIENGIVRDSLCKSKQMQFCGYRTMLSLCLEKLGKVPKVKDKSDGSSVFHALVSLGYADLVSNFMKRNQPDVNDMDNKNRTVLHVACSLPNNKIVKLVLSDKKAKVNAQDCVGRTALHKACKQGFNDIATTLIANGADINKRDDLGSTPIHIAISEGHESLAHLLIEKNANIICEDKTGKSPLIIACENHNNTIIKMLLDKIHISSQSKHYRSILQNACRQGNEDVVEALVKHNQNMDVQFSDGSTPLHIACKENNLNILKILLANNCDKDVKNKAGMTSLFQSCSENRLEIVKLLLMHSADTNCTGKSKKTPLHVACMKGFNEIALVLMKAHADVNARDKYGRTPLFGSCIKGDMNLIRRLLDNGADVTIRDNNSMLASTVAEENGFPEVAEMLNNWNIQQETIGNIIIQKHDKT